MADALFEPEQAAPPPPWWDGRLCGLDLETTEPDPTEARALTVSIALVGGGHDPWSHTWMVNPGAPIPVEASLVNGIEDADVEDCPRFDYIAQDVADVLAEAVEQRIPLVAFNAVYDCTVLDRELRRHGFEDAAELLKRARVIDPVVIDRWLDRYRKGSRKLYWVCRAWNVEVPQEKGAHHVGADDAITAARLAWRLGRNGRVRLDWPEHERVEQQAEWERVRADLELLHEAQRRWRWADQLRLRELWREQGNPKWETTRPEWPVYPQEPYVDGVTL